MTLRRGLVLGITILGLAMLGLWSFAPSILADARQLIDRDAL